MDSNQVSNNLWIGCDRLTCPPNVIIMDWGATIIGGCRLIRVGQHFRLVSYCLVAARRLRQTGHDDGVLLTCSRVVD